MKRLQKNINFQKTTKKIKKNLQKRANFQLICFTTASYEKEVFNFL